MMKKLPAIILFFFIFLTCTKYSYSQSPTSVIGEAADDPEQAEFTLDPPQFPSDDRPDYYITDYTPSVTVSFPNLDFANDNYYICLSNDYCITNYAVAALDDNKFTRQLTTAGFKDSEMAKKKLKPIKELVQNGAIKVCGKGPNALQANNDCDDKDYFHAGNFYIITIYSKADNYVGVARAGFYVSHGLPTVNVTPSSGGQSGTQFSVEVKQPTIRAGKNRNNYQVVLEGPGYKREQCSDLNNESRATTFKFPTSKDEDLNGGFSIPGNYLFKINEQNNETNRSLRTDDCQGGFTYATVTCNIDTKISKTTCKPPVYDPKGEDGKKLGNLFNILNKDPEGKAKLPCSNKGANAFVENPLECQALDTAIGRIQLTPTGFIVRLFSIVLSIAGIGALFLIIYSGYRMMISRGNPESLKGARETLTAAVIGLAFIVFSMVLLSVIAVDVLKIPGFG